MTKPQSASRNLTLREFDSSYPLPIECDLKQLKAKRIEEYQKTFRKFDPSMSEEDSHKRSLECFRVDCLIEGIFYVEAWYPRISKDDISVANMLMNLSLTRALHEQYLDHWLFPKWVRHATSDCVRVLLAEEVREWAIEAWTKNQDENCAIGAELAPLELQSDIRRIRAAIRELASNKDWD
jgi:hypothetical protein